MNNGAYWRQRFGQLEQAAHDYGVKAYSEIAPEFDRAQRQIRKEIEAWYQRFAENNEISMQIARKWLNSDELDELKWDIDEYIKYGRLNSMDKNWMKQLENASAKFHISRLEALLLRTQQAAEKAFGNEADVIDSMMREVYSESYYHGIYEVQKAFGVAWTIGQIDERKLEKLITKPWAADGYNFSERIWKSKSELIDELNKQLTRTCILGKTPDDAIKAISKKFSVSKSQAGRLVMTEQAYIHAAAQQDAFKELGVGEFEIVATLDSRTSEICREMDGKHFPMSEYEVGVTAPPFHPNCRSVTAPYFDDDPDGIGERAARDGDDGKTYQVPGDMTYKEWENKYISVSETQKISKKVDANDYSVDRALVNSKEYHDKFENLTEYKAVNESIYQEAMKILEHRDGTDFEDITIIDARSGKIIIKNDTSTQLGRTGLSKEQYAVYQQHTGEKIILHNHPNSGRLSYTDILTMYKNADITHSIAIGHDGSVHIISNINRNIDIEGIYKSLYNEYKSTLMNSNLAKARALDELYRRGVFDYTRR